MIARVVVLVACTFATAFGQGPHSAASGTDPCSGTNDPVLFSADGLSPVQGGQLVYDSKEGLCWLADANLAGNPYVRAAVTLAPMNPDGSKPVINPDGTMDYETAVNWVQSLNRYNGGKGWLNHNQWQLPANPATDPTCSSFNNANFGIQCTGSPMGYLYNTGLAMTYPNSVVPYFLDFVWPFFNLQRGLAFRSASPLVGNFLKLLQSAIQFCGQFRKRSDPARTAGGRRPAPASADRSF